MKQSYQLKGSLFTLTVVQLLVADRERIVQDFKQSIKQTANFFKNAPIILDLNKLPAEEHTLNLLELCQNLRELGLIIVGIRSADSSHQQQAIENGLAVLPGTTEDTAENATKATKTKASQNENVSKNNLTKVVTQPVRSGQQIYAKGDLIILSSVSPGAEVLADGHIHIYGPLRGRALAGVLGDSNARIFCKSLEAELISIAGHYLVNENLSSVQINKDTQILLENEQLHIMAM